MTIKQRISEIDRYCELLRAEQKGLEKALIIVEGLSSVTEPHK